MRRVLWTILILSSLLYVGCSSSTESSSIVAPVITQQPSNIAAGTGSITEISVKASGENLTYQWQQLTLDANKTILSVVNLADSVDEQILITVTADINGVGYRCIVTNGGGSDTSDIAQIIIKEPLIDLSSFKATNAATSSRPAHIKRVGEKLYIGLQRLNDDWTATETSYVIVVNTVNNVIIDTIITTGYNIGDMEVVGDYLYVVNTGSLYTHGDGKVERISLLDHSIETVYEGVQDISNIEHFTGNQFFVSVYSYDFVEYKGVTPVHLCDFTTGIFVETVTGVENGQHLLYSVEDGVLYIGESHGATRGEVKVYNTTTKAVTAIPTTLGISSMAVYGSGVDKSIVLTESDYATGYLGEIKAGAYSQKLIINSDAQVAVADEHLFVLEKYGADNLMKVSPTDYSVLYQVALTDEYNPYAATVVNGIGYLLSYEYSTLNTFIVSNGLLN